MVNTFRYGILGVSDIDVVYALSAVAVFIVSMFSLALSLLNKGKGIRS